MINSFNLLKLLHDVFAPDEHDTAIVMVDTPTDKDPDNPDWQERRAMAAEWLEGLAKIGVQTQPLLSFKATGGNNADLPASGEQNGTTVPMEQTLSTATLVIAMTRYSATAPLSMLTKKFPDLRVASMPNVLRRMEKSALSADYLKVAKIASMLTDWLNNSESAHVVFSTGHECRFDLRYRVAHADDGLCRRDKKGFKLINLPSGEAFSVPYEGEIPGEPSKTEGQIPLWWKDHIYTLDVHHNFIGEIQGDGPDRKWLEDHFNIDNARRNVAELGLGCNENAVITGNVLEDEKAGFHWAYGRSEHLGGTVGPDKFSDPSHVVHHDVVYAKGCPIEIKRLDLIDAGGSRRTVITDGSYVEAFS